MLSTTSVYELKSDPRARSRAVAIGTLRSGQTALVEAPLTVVVHPTHKAKRCDQCLREAEGLQKCSGCGVYCYCGRECQSTSWKRHHRRLCGFSKLYVQSSEYKDTTQDAQADVFLLAQLAAEHLYKVTNFDDTRAIANTSVQTFWDLLPFTSSHASQNLPPLDFTSPTVLSAAVSRFGNNNFVVHDAHLVPFAHGVFSLASRAFNHSCVPNAAAMFEQTEYGVHMVVKLLADIADGEEICISYTDPASSGTKRREALQHAYGFNCRCPRCASEAVSHAPAPLGGLNEYELQNQIQLIVGAGLRNVASELVSLRDAMEDLRPYLDVALLSWLPGWTEEFSRCSHEGPFDQALRLGNAVLGVYLLIYPGLHPLLELHCLELSKIAWNYYTTNFAPNGSEGSPVRETSTSYLKWAKSIADRGSEGLEHSRASIEEEYRMLEECLNILQI
ncbi:hypothetical protein BDV93DRAFT_526343 [Ceratobasidium sp. AG-I]|nr:hypothetical protein BDV93DRAFT_526343 [Ceratobasidium sp. AG-I]